MKLRIPIAAKLVVSALGLVGFTALTLAIQSSDLFEKTSRHREDSINLSEAMARGTEIEQVFLSLIDKVQLMGNLALEQKSQKDKKLLTELFYNDRDLVSLEVVEVLDYQYNSQNILIREELLKPYNLTADAIFKLRDQSAFPWLDVRAGETVIRNSSELIQAPLFTIGIPLRKSKTGVISHIAVADIRLSRLQKSFSQKSARMVYLLDPTGKVLAHSDEKQALEAKAYGDSPLHKKAQQSKLRTGQMRFVDPNSNEAFIGAYSKISLGLVLMTQVKESVILEPSQRLRRESFYLTGLLLSAALLVILLGSLGFTLPIERLVAITHQIAKGEFDVGASGKVKSRDEVGDLARSFDEMAVGLKERDKVKNLFSKFHGSQVAQDLIGKDIALGGVKKEVTVFFSDIRGFTALSETTPAEEVVELLNSYFAVMVEIITRHGGIVDKFIGDAIMAVWGAPTPTDDDSYHAVYASLEMRQALEKFNEDLMLKGKAPIKIGMGLHSGYVISGTIGSDERMEYTVIGDTVNVASRIEASTKALGTDLLISESVVADVYEKFDLVLGGEVAVKGKSSKMSLYKVRGYKDQRGEVIPIRTRYSDFEAEEDPKVKVS